MYSVETDVDALPEVEALPQDALPFCAETMALLEVAAWSGETQNRTHAGSGMRTATFGTLQEGLVVYLILEDQRRVVVLRVLWTG